MNLPRIYISIVLTGTPEENRERVRHISRQVFLAGFEPVCPAYYLPEYVNNDIPAERKNGVDIARAALRRSKLLLVCDDPALEAISTDIAVAGRYDIPATTLSGFLEIQTWGRKNQSKHED